MSFCKRVLHRLDVLLDLFEFDDELPETLECGIDHFFAEHFQRFP